VQVEAVDLRAGTVTIRNRYNFSSLGHLKGSWAVAREGEIIEEGDLPPLDVPAGGETTVTLPYRLPKAEPGAGCWLNLSFTLAEATLWAPRGFEVAWAQFRLPAEAAEPPVILTRGMPPITAVESDELITLSADDFRVCFDKWSGVIGSWHYHGTSLVNIGPRFNAWRAPIDNDVYVANQWRGAGLDRLTHRVDRVAVHHREAGAVQVEVYSAVGAASLPIAFRCAYHYTVYGTGDVVIETHVSPNQMLPVLPRIGLQMRLPGEFDRFTWYGRGPHESYVDRKESARVGVYDGTVQDQYVPYIKPQENGNKTEVRWAAVTNARGIGVIAVGMPLLEVSAHHYTPEDFTQARHTFDLVRRDETIFHIDYRQSGLGSASCGPKPLPQYLIEPKEMTFRVRLKAFSAESMSPARLARQRFEDLKW
jgi:hypothetical protein